MSRVLQLGALLVVVALVLPLAAQEKQKGKKQSAIPPAVKSVTDALASLDLTAEQKEKIKPLQAKLTEQLNAINKERSQIVTPEVNRKMNEARQAAQAQGKKGRELQDAAYAASGLSAEQIAKLRDLQTKQQQAIQDFRRAVSEILTPEQRQKAGLNVEGKKGAKKKNT
jgi:Spy/CpxP family protein refolding chaperone